MASNKTSPSEPGTGGPIASFKCVHQGCAKTFTRKDHLIRHQANHSTAIHTCTRCGRPFKRLDLLQRHERRNICTETTDGAGGSVVPGPWNGVGWGAKRARSGSSSSSSTGRPSAAFRAIQPSSSSYIPPPSAGMDSTLLTGFEMFDGWDPVLLQQDAWYPSLTDTMAGPFNEPLAELEMPWDMAMSRTQESAARGQQLMASPGLAATLQAAYPGYDMSLPLVVDYLHLYWTRVAPSFPFIHQGTLDLDSAPSYLIVLMLVTGSVHSANRQDFSPLVSSIRGQLVSQCGMEAPVSIFQAFALCHIFDTWYGNLESLFIAQNFWANIVGHSRKKGIGVQGGSSGDGEDEVWANWAKGEDTHISAFWHQHSSRQLSIFAHDLPLPCPRSQWEATSAGDWSRASAPGSHVSTKRANRGAYLPGLHPEFRITQIPDGYSSAILSAMVAQADLQFIVDLENYLAVQMVLLGLMGTAWDQRIKGGMGIKFKEGAKHWRKLTQDALIHLRATWEGATSHVAPCTETRDLRDKFGICIMSVLSDIPMLVALSGASTICGSTLSSKHHADAKKRCRIWVKSDDGFTCLWQSARYLKQALLVDWGIYTPWAVFLTTLVLYSYATTSTNTTPTFPRPTSSPTDGTNALLDTILASNTRPDLGHEPLLDLLQCAADKLSTHGELDRGNAALLRRLIEENSTVSPIDTGMSGMIRRSSSHVGTGLGLGNGLVGQNSNIRGGDSLGLSITSSSTGRRIGGQIGIVNGTGANGSGTAFGGESGAAMSDARSLS